MTRRRYVRQSAMPSLTGCRTKAAEFESRAALVTDWQLKATFNDLARFYRQKPRDRYMDAYEDMIRHTSTPEAPWYVVPADNKWFARLVVAAALVDALDRLDFALPQGQPGAARGNAAHPQGARGGEGLRRAPFPSPEGRVANPFRPRPARPGSSPGLHSRCFASARTKGDARRVAAHAVIELVQDRKQARRAAKRIMADALACCPADCRGNRQPAATRLLDSR